MPDSVPPARTARLEIAPLRVTDAAEMLHVLSAPSVYEFTGGEPPTLAGLTARYERQVAGAPAWINLIARLAGTGEVVGVVQATIEADHTEIAWVVGEEHRGRGFAAEAAAELVAMLARRGVRTVVAHIHPLHVASQRVAERLGLEPTDVVVDGEVRWRRTV
jgi:RimJ/RimL family protein N-acetyltransferase